MDHFSIGRSGKKERIVINRYRIGLVAAMAAWALIGPSAVAQTANHAPPNVVFFLIDDLGWEDVGFMGSTRG